MPDALDTCIDCGAICEDTRCRQCWAKNLLRQDAASRCEECDTPGPPVICKRCMAKLILAPGAAAIPCCSRCGRELFWDDEKEAGRCGGCDRPAAVEEAERIMGITDG